MLQRCSTSAACLKPSLISAVLASTSSVFFRSASSNFSAQPVTGGKPSASSDASAKVDDADHKTTKSILADISAQNLGQQHVGNFYKLRSELLPEALSTSPAGKQQAGPPTRVSAGLQDEVAATRTQAIMYRESIHALKGALLPRGSRTLLRGPTGCGKSLALVALVEWARANGWIVMYVPSATVLTRGGYFVPRPETGTFDTILSAQQVLRSMVQAHGKQLAAIPGGAAPKEDGKPARSLLDVANEGLATDSNASLAVDSCLALVEGLTAASAQASSAPNVLFAIDDYNALHWRTGYGRAAEDGTRVPLTVNDLTLASRLRLLTAEGKGSARVLAAVSGSRGIPDDAKLPTAANVGVFHMPRYSLVEAAHALYWYWECGLAPGAPTQEQVRTMQALTNGNAKEMRMLAPKMTLLSSGMI